VTLGVGKAVYFSSGMPDKVCTPKGLVMRSWRASFSGGIWVIERALPGGRLFRRLINSLGSTPMRMGGASICSRNMRIVARAKVSMFVARSSSRSSSWYSRMVRVCRYAHDLATKGIMWLRASFSRPV